METNELDILVVGAHPDDAEIGCGATIAHYTANNYRVGILDLTNGEPTPYGTPKIRMQEAKRAAEILKVQVRETLDLPNRYLQNTIDARTQIADVFRKYRPKVIITHPPQDWHEDHIRCHQLVNAAKFQAKLSKTSSQYPPYYPPRILYFDHTHQKQQRILDFYIDVSEVFEIKIQALEAYESQFSKNPQNLHFLDQLRIKAEYCGTLTGVHYAEGFLSPEPFKISNLLSL